MTTTDIIKFSLQERKMIHMHTLTHTRALTPSDTQRRANCMHFARHCAPKSKGVQTKPTVRLPVTFQEVRALETRDLYFLCSATLKTQDFEDGCGAAMIF